MKQVTLKDIGKFKAKPIIRGLISTKPEGLDLDEYRKRVRVLKAIDSAEKEDSDVLTLEDNDFLTLKNAIKGCRAYTIVEPEILEILEAAMTGKDVTVQKGAKLALVPSEGGSGDED